MAGAARGDRLPVLVDGAQSVGAIDVDAAAADFYTVSAQKWLCGPDATGALYVRDPERAAAAARRLPERRVVRHRRGDVGAEGRARARFDTGFHAAVVARPGSRPRSPACPQGASSARAELTEHCRELLARRRATTS